MVENNVDTIVAIATPPGRGGVGVVRVSGPLVLNIITKILRQTIKPRQASHLAFYSPSGIIDQGIAIFFQGPHSFTGEDVLELLGHGGPFVMEALVHTILAWGARRARPGEFSERAFINNKIDLLQAEAVADLINAHSEQASRAAMRSLQGDFSRLIEGLVESVIHLRIYIEAALDFPEEEVAFLQEGHVLEKLQSLGEQLDDLCIKANQGVKMARGVKVVIAGKPNAGKSSLFNRLSGLDSAIVTDIPGTTRDVIKEEIQLEGLVLQLVDTAGLRDSDDQIEQEGIRRTKQELSLADHVIVVVDACEDDFLCSEWEGMLPPGVKLTVLYNKVDALETQQRHDRDYQHKSMYVSAKTGLGIPLFLTHLKSILGATSTVEGSFIARRRHVEALLLAKQHLDIGVERALESPELLAEELRWVQRALDEITGKFTSDDLLGKIFGEFCIGK